MSRLFDIITMILPVLYAGTLGLYVRHFFESEDGERFWGSGLLYVLLLVHTGYLIVLAIWTDHFPIANQSEFFSVLSLSVGATYGLAERRHREANTGIFFLAIVFLFALVAALTSGDPGVIPDRSRNPVYGFHVIFTVFGFAGLTVSTIYAVMYILLNRQLKSRNLGLIFQRLPALSTLEQMSRLATTSGVLLLGVGLALGHYVALDQFQSLDLLSHPIILVADIAWIGYLVGLIVARTKGLSGIRMGYLSVGGYFVFMTSLVVVLTQIGTFHAFG